MSGQGPAGAREPDRSGTTKPLPASAGRGFRGSAALTRRHLTTTARMSRAERIRYSSPEYFTSVPPYLL